MSLADAMIRLAAPAYNLIHADAWTILSGPLAGTVFSGDAQTEAPVVLDTDLGTDGREKTMLYVDRPIPAITKSMRLSGKGQIWQVVGGIDDNPANDRVKFEIVKLTAKDP
jgi:hypothetical protein